MRTWEQKTGEWIQKNKNFRIFLVMEGTRNFTRILTAYNQKKIGERYKQTNYIDRLINKQIYIDRLTNKQTDEQRSQTHLLHSI
jgi:hypothetical protein